jgi:hypothetical protein
LDGTDRRSDRQPECRKDSKLAIALLEASIACATKAVGMITSVLASYVLLKPYEKPTGPQRFTLSLHGRDSSVALKPSGCKNSAQSKQF